MHYTRAAFSLEEFALAEDIYELGIDLSALHCCFYCWDLILNYVYCLFFLSLAPWNRMRSTESGNHIDSSLHPFPDYFNCLQHLHLSLSVEPIA